MSESARVRANAERRRAVRPAASVVVAASVGTGRNKLLTDRLLRLMPPASGFLLANCRARANLRGMKTAAKHRRPAAPPSPELAPPGAPPHVAVAPGVLDQAHVVIRADDDSDEDYAARCRVFAAALDFARKG
jgi:hypothetical protein